MAEDTQTIPQEALETLDADGFTVAAEALRTRRTLDLSGLSADEQFALVQSRALGIITEDRLKDLLHSSVDTKKPLRVKFGIDPTGTDVHLGHAVPMLIANRLQRMGHDVVVIVGDVTARIGDPSGRSKERPPLTAEQIADNMQTYQEQMAPFFNFDSAELCYNSSWLDTIAMPELLELLSKVPVSMQLQREDFRTRLEAGQSLSTAELLYSIMMAYDSVAVRADIEIGGVDQLLNLQMCRKVMGVRDLEPEVIITTDLIEGTDGNGSKMSKSKGNYIGLHESAAEIFGKVMSIPDRLLVTYFKALTEMHDDEIALCEACMKDQSINPLIVKKLLAYDIVSAIHGMDAATNARRDFEAQFSERSLTSVSDMQTVHLQTSDERSVVDVLQDALGFVSSRSDARRLAQGGAVQLVLEGTESVVCKLSEDDVLRGSMLEVMSTQFPEREDTAPLFIKVGRKVAKIVL